VDTQSSAMQVTAVGGESPSWKEPAFKPGRHFESFEVSNHSKCQPTRKRVRGIVNDPPGEHFVK